MSCQVCHRLICRCNTPYPPASPGEARDAALEEAAKLCDEWAAEDVPGAVVGRTLRLAEAIRDLKGSK